DEGDDVLVEALRRFAHLDGRLETILVLVDVDSSHLIDRLLNCWHRALILFACLSFAVASRVAPLSHRAPAALGREIGPSVQKACDVALRGAMAQTDADGSPGELGGEAHGREHMARPDLARGARGARADRNTRQIELDDQRLGAGTGQR